MTDTDFLTIDLIGLQDLVSDQDMDLESLTYLKDRNPVSFDALIGKQDRARIERKGKRVPKVYPIVRQEIRFRNVTGLETRVRKGQWGLFGVTVHQRKEGRIEISGCGGKLVITVSNLQIKLGPETETEHELVERTLWFGIWHHTWRLRRSFGEQAREG